MGNTLKYWALIHSTLKSNKRFSPKSVSTGSELLRRGRWRPTDQIPAEYFKKVSI